MHRPLLILVLFSFSLACQNVRTGEVRQEVSVESSKVRLPDGFDVQGHRGARGLRPESTLPSIEVALDLKIDTLELDLHLSKDDELIVWHDPFIQADKCRVPEGADLPNPAELAADDQALMIRNLSAEELRQYRCDLNPEPARFPDQSTEPTALAGDDFGILTLAEVFAFLDLYVASESKPFEARSNARTLRFNLETKREPLHPEYIGDDFDGQEPAVFELQLISLLESRRLQERANLQSFDHQSLWAARSRAPWLQLAALDREIETSFEEFAERGATIWSPRARLVTAKSLQAAHSAGLKVIPWTVNDIAEMERLISLGVDGIITDRPDLLVAFRSE